jgi:hypothetical protein
VDLNDFTKNNVCNFSSDIQDGICQIVMAKHRFFKVGISVVKIPVIFVWVILPVLLRFFC